MNNISGLFQNCIHRQRQKAFEKELIPLIFDKKVGSFDFACLKDDPEFEQQFQTWIEAGVKMARKPGGFSSLWINFIPFLWLVPPVNGENWKMIDRWQIAFRWEEYEMKKIEIFYFFKKAKDLKATIMVVILINSGDALEQMIRNEDMV